MAAKETFREDLYYRLNVVQITLPPLNKRKEDIRSLVEYFLEKSSNISRNVCSNYACINNRYICSSYCRSLFLHCNLWNI